MIVEENQVVRHKQWRGYGRVERNRLNGEVDVFWLAPNGKVMLRTAYIDDLVPPRKTDRWGHAR